MGNTGSRNGSDVVVRRGDLMTEECDLIIHPSDRHMSFKGLVGGEIMRRGNQLIQDEARAKARQMRDQGFCITSGSGLNCSHILHVAVRNEPEAQFRQTLIQAFTRAARELQGMDITSVAMPAIGAGKLHMPPRQSALMVVGIVFELKSKLNFPARDIRIIIKDERNMRDYQTSLLEKTAVRRTAPRAGGAGRYESDDADDERDSDDERRRLEESVEAALPRGFHIRRVEKADNAEELAGRSLSRMTARRLGGDDDEPSSLTVEREGGDGYDRVYVDND